MSWYLLRQAFASHRYFLIFAHRDPDGDAIGSCAALWRLLSRLGKRACIVLEKSLPSAYELILPSHAIILAEGSGNNIQLRLPLDWQEPIQSQLDSLACLWVDFQDSVRLGSLSVLFDKSYYTAKKTTKGVLSAGDLALVPLGVIDHHTPRMGQVVSDLHVIEPRVSSCGVLIYHLFHLLGIEIDSESAAALYWAVISDTAQFSVYSTQSLDHEIAAECMKLGVVPSQLQEALSERFRVDTVIRGLKALEHARCDESARCWVFVLGYQEAELGGVSLLRFIHQLMPKMLEPQVWLVVLEEAPNLWRFSARSRQDIQLGVFFQTYGGGGHGSAAGVSHLGPVQPIIEAFMHYACKQLDCTGALVKV